MNQVEERLCDVSLFSYMQYVQLVLQWCYQQVKAEQHITRLGIGYCRGNTTLWCSHDIVMLIPFINYSAVLSLKVSIIHYKIHYCVKCKACIWALICWAFPLSLNGCFNYDSHGSWSNLKCTGPLSHYNTRASEKKTEVIMALFITVHEYL